MASPQVEQGFIKIANELWNELIRRDFSKRQQNIILLIWRLSYGCRRKDCFIEKFNAFEVVGLNKSDIKKELKFLKECKVIDWDENSMTFSINKNYEQWQITPSKGWDSEKFRELISVNLSTKYVAEKVKDEKIEVGKTPTKKYRLVGKTPTTELVKHQPRHVTSPTAPVDTAAVKTSLKTSFKDITTTTVVAYAFYENNFGIMSPHIRDKYNMWMDEFEDQDDVLTHAMKIALERNKKNWGYIESILKDWFSKGARSLSDCKALQVEYLNQFAPKTTGGKVQPKAEEFDLDD